MTMPVKIESGENLPSVREPVGILKASKKRLMTQEEAEAAAKRAGFTIVKARKLAGQKELGEFITQQGVVKIGRSMLAFSAENLANSIEQCDELLEKLEDPESRASLMQTKQHLQQSYIKVAESLIKSAEVDASDGADAGVLANSFAPRQSVVPAVAVQINNGSKKENGNA